MKALLIPGDGRVEMVDLPDAEPGPGEVKIQMKRSGICGTDLFFLRETRDARGMGAGIVPGHESAGVIVATGAGVTSRVIGERVVGYHHIGCGACRFCRADLPTQCADKTVTGRTRHGSNAEFIVLPAWAAFPLPAAFDFDEGVLLACNVSTAFSALRKAKASALQKIAVFGQGVVGLSVLMLGLKMGAQIAAIDVSSSRLQIAQDLGASLVLNPNETDVVSELRNWSGGRGLQAVIECSGSSQAARQGLDALGARGVMVFVGAGSELTLSSNDLLGREVKLLGSSVYRPSEFQLLVDFICDKSIPIRDLIESTFEPEDAAAAFELAATQTKGKLLFAWS